KKRPGAVLLAWQCQQLGDRALADNLLTLALDGATDKDEVLGVSLAACEYLWHTGQTARADEVVQRLFKVEKLAEQSELWRLASTLAQRRGHTARSIACLEKALDLEYRDLPDVIDLEQWRGEYGRLLAHYSELASAVSSLEAAPPADLAAKTVRAADR